MEEDEILYNRLCLDYEQTNETWRMLADVRFKLLALVPAVSGTAIALLSRDFEGTVFQLVTMCVLSVLGFVVTLGVVIYDQRNSQISNETFFRACWLEKELKFLSRQVIITLGGHHTNRPGRVLCLFKRWAIWHDLGLALIYGSVLGAWVFPVSYAALSLLVKPFTEGLPYSLQGDVASGIAVLSIAVAVVTAYIFICELLRLDRCASGKARPEDECDKKCEESKIARSGTTSAVAP